MTVKELIEILKKEKPDLEILIESESGDNYAGGRSLNDINQVLVCSVNVALSARKPVKDIFGT
jgi:hypothetical protein